MKPKEGLYALYLRKSRADLEKESYGEFETLAKHERELTALAERGGYALDKPYYKELVSGERIADRAEFQKLMRKVSNGEYAGVVVHSISRLGRGDPMEYGWILFVLKSTRTVIVTPTRTFDPNDPDDARYLQMEMFVSNMELGNIRSRLVSGARASARAGCYLKPKAPMGYDRARIDGKWTLVPNEDADIVRTIFERVADGAPVGRVARDLNAEGIPTQTGKQWCPSRIHSIIKNPHYKGMIRFGYYHSEKVPAKDGFGYRLKYSYNDDCILVDGLHEAIVPPEVWEKANATRTKSPRTKRELKNPLAGLLYCSECGYAIKRSVVKGSNGAKREYYRHDEFRGCSMRICSVSKLLDLLCGALEQAAEEMEVEIESGKRTDSEQKAIRAALKKEERKLDKLMELYFADAITIDEFKIRREASESARESMERRLRELEAEKPPTKKKVATLRKAMRVIKSDKASAADKNAFLKQVIKRIDYYRREGDVELTVTLK